MLLSFLLLPVLSFWIVFLFKFLGFHYKRKFIEECNLYLDNNNKFREIVKEYDILGLKQQVRILCNKKINLHDDSELEEKIKIIFSVYAKEAKNREQREKFAEEVPNIVLSQELRNNILGFTTRRLGQAGIITADVSRRNLIEKIFIDGKWLEMINLPLDDGVDTWYLRSEYNKQSLGKKAGKS